MNRRISTLMASVLFASAFTVNAQTPVEGDYVQLIISGNALTENATDHRLEATGATPTVYSEGVFDEINGNLWKIEKITKVGTAGTSTFRFINKKTGKHLAIKLRTNTKAYETEYAATLDEAGNKDWSFSNGINGGYLYAYDAASDSTFFLTSDLKLRSKKGVSNTWINVGSFSLTPFNNGISLSADAFNEVVGLVGNTGKLHFNNGKDVSKDESNILKNTKWKANEAGSNVFALTDGSKTKGHLDAPEYDSDAKAWKKQDKLNYLMVDTACYDKSGKYFKLVKDTVAYENLTASLSGKPEAVRPVNAAKFTGVFYPGTDSLVLSASYVPRKYQQSGGSFTAGSYSTTKADLLPLFTAAAADAAVKEAKLKTAVDNLFAAYRSFVDNGAHGDLFATNNADEITAVRDAKYVANTDLDTWLNGFANLAMASEAGELVDQIDAWVTANSTNAYATKMTNLKNAVSNWAAQSTISDAFVNTKFDASGNISSSGTKPTEATGVVYVIVNESGYSTSWAINGYVESAKALTAVDAKATPSTTIAAYAGDYTNEEALANNIVALQGEADAWYTANPTTSTTASAFKTSSNEGEIASLLDGELKTKLDGLTYTAAVEVGAVNLDIYFDGEHTVQYVAANNGQVVLRNLSTATVLTVVNDGATNLENAGYIEPLIQPYATTGGDAKIATTKYHFLQVKNVGKAYEPSLKAVSLANKYWAIDWTDGITGTGLVTVSEVSEANPFTQWAFVEGATGSYSIINRATEKTIYSGPLFKVAGEEDTYTNGTDTLKVAAVEIPESAIITEGTTKYDISGQFYPGKEEELIQRLFSVSPVSPFMSQLAMQVNKDSVLILGDAADAPVWQLKQVAGSKKTYGYTLDGYAPLLQVQYNIYTKDADDNVYYVINDVDGDTYEAGEAYRITKSDSKMGDTDKAAFTFYAVAPGQYLMVDEDGLKVTINPTPAKPILETSEIDSERDDYFTFTQVNQNVYRELGVSIEDNLAAKAPNVAKIFMDNEPNRFLYENTANIVANNGKGLNFLGIYNSAELTKNAALYVDTAWVDRKDNLKPLYMLALGVDTVDAKDAVACTYEHNHFDNAGNKVDAEHCSHATPATLGYKSGRYLVALNDSVPENLSKNSPVYYDGKVRLAFVDAIHYLTKDTLVIKKSKYTGNSKQQVAGEETTWAAKDTIEITKDLNAATFALRIKDQATKSFYLENANGYVRILNGVPVLEKTITDAAIFNIAATEEEATANEAIEAATVQVIAGKGAITVQGAAGKVVTVANILGQTIANQVAASDNVTIAAPAGVLVVTVDGEATKVVVK